MSGATRPIKNAHRTERKKVSVSAMGSIFEKLWRLGPAPILLKAIIAALVADGILLAFILLRRMYRKRYFAKRDARVFEMRQIWDKLIAGEIPYHTWRKKPF